MRQVRHGLLHGKSRSIVCGAVVALLLLGAAPGSMAQEREIIDRIAAVVGEEIILLSEVAAQIQLIALQSGRQIRNEAELKKMEKDVLDQMVSDRLFLIAARDDTTVVVREEEVDQALDEQVLRISKNFDTYDAFLAALANEGLTVRDLKKKYRSDVENQLLKQRYIQRKLYSVSVSRREVEEFYEQFRDSIPAQPEAAKLAHILLSIDPAPKVVDSIQAYVAELRQKVLDGADFGVISSQYSTGNAGRNGGDLGYIAREDVVPEFARAAFNLNPGDISGVIRTQFGFHVIKCEGQKGDLVRLRHILVEVKPTADDTVRTRNQADSLTQAAQAGADFAVLAKDFSVDNETRAQGGELGWFATASLPVEFADSVRGWITPGEVRGPVQSQLGYHVLKLLDYQPHKDYTLEEDFDEIKELARQDKTGRLVDLWIEDLKDQTYIRYALDR